MDNRRIWYPFTFEDGDSRVYQVSFRLAEEATWDHRFHDLDGREIAAEDLRLSPSHLRHIQASCDSAVGDGGLIARMAKWAARPASCAPARHKGTRLFAVSASAS